MEKRFDFMLAEDRSLEAEKFFGNNELVMEPKLDGIRAMVHIDDNEVVVQLRNRGKDTRMAVTENFPFLKELGKVESVNGVTLDGEIVAYKNGKKPKYQFEENDLYKVIAVNGSLPSRAAELIKTMKIEFIPFDIVRFNFQPTTDLPWKRRREILESVCKDLGLKPIDYWSNLKRNYEFIVGRGGEGVILKDMSSTYTQDRSNKWLKIKKFEDVVAYFGSQVQPGSGRLSGMVGSVSVYDGNGNFLGFVSGIDDEMRKKMTDFTADGQMVLDIWFVGRQVLIRHNGATGRGGFRHARVIKIANGDEDLESLR